MPDDTPFYDEFFVDNVTGNPKLSLPVNRPQLVEQYLAQLELATVNLRQIGIIDVKYNSMHVAEGVWYTPGSVPMLLLIAKRRNYRVLHLTRSDLLAVVFSKFRADNTGDYYVREFLEVMPTRFRIEPEEFLDELRILYETEWMARHWLEMLDISHLQVRYESMFQEEPGSDLNRNLFKQLFRYINVDQPDFVPTPQSRKISTRGFRQELENFDEIEEALKGTRFHEDFVSRG